MYVWCFRINAFKNNVMLVTTRSMNLKIASLWSDHIHKIIRKPDLWLWVWGYHDLNFSYFLADATMASIWQCKGTSFSSYGIHKLGCPCWPPALQWYQSFKWGLKSVVELFALAHSSITGRASPGSQAIVSLPVVDSHHPLLCSLIDT